MIIDKRKVLIVADTFPYPVSRNGNTENIYNLISNLKEDQNILVDMVFIGDIKSKTEDSLTFVQAKLNKLHLIQLKFHIFLRLSKFLFKKNLGLSDNYDIIFFTSFSSSYTRFNFPKTKKTILYQADSRTLFYSFKRGLSNRIRYYKFKIEQKMIFKYFDKVIFVSEIDKLESDIYTKLNSKTIVIPIGVNLPSSDNFKDINKDIDMIFTGNFHFAPNSDAAEKFLMQIFPDLLIRIPNIKICFAGRYPTTQMLENQKKYPDNIFVTGEVPSISDFLLRAKIYFSPIYWGGGMKNKILQAMSHKLPVICTIESTAGIQNKELFYIVNDTKSWVEACNNLLNNIELRKKAGENNYKEVSSNYTFHKITSNYFIPLFRSLMPPSSLS